MKILVPLFALLLIGGTATAQEKGRAQEMYHVSWTDKHGKQKCHNGASKAQAEKNAAKKRTKKGVTKVMLGAGKCDRDQVTGSEGKPGQVRKPRPTGQKPQVGKPGSTDRADEKDVMRKKREKEMKAKVNAKEKKEKEKVKEKKEK